MQLIFEQIRVGGDRNFAYLFGDRDAGQAVVIDPSYSPQVVVERATAQGLTVTHIVNTHGHADHTEGNATAVDLTGASIAAHPGAPDAPGVPLADAQELRVGSLALRCLHTPGHCDDHVVLYEPANQLLVTGDLIFIGKVGGAKTDDDARTEWTSLQRVLETVPDEATVWPGHDYGARPSSTIGLERRTNPFLLCADVDAFLRLRTEWSGYKMRLGLK
jgi:glyoxylase-like metal-dependent hydrolase (beta-lactamase superfamily II)